MVVVLHATVVYGEGCHGGGAVVTVVLVNVALLGRVLVCKVVVLLSRLGWQA